VFTLQYVAIDTRRFWGFYVTSVPTTERMFCYLDEVNKDFDILVLMERTDVRM